MVRNKKRFSIRKLVKPLLFFAALATIGAGCKYVVMTPKLSIKRVEINGTRLLNSQTLVNETWNAINADRGPIGRYRNILFLQKSRINAVLVKKHPEIDTLEIGRLLPSKVIINVRERKPVAVATNGQSHWLVDKDSAVFHRVYNPIPWLPTILLVPNAQLPKPGKNVTTMLNYGVDCAQYSRRTGLKVTKISIDQAGNLCLNMGSEFYVKLGQSVDLRQKLEQLSTIIESKPEIVDNGLYMDLTCKERPAYVAKADAVKMRGTPNVKLEATPNKP